MSDGLRQRLSAALAAPQRLLLSPQGGEFEAWCREHPGSAVELLVSARALHELVCDPGLPLDDLDAVRAYARQQFAHYFGAASQRFALAPWRCAGRAGASALHGLDLDALQAQAREARVRIAAVRPVWSAWLASLPASVRAGSGRLAWVEADLAVLIQLERGTVVGLQPRRVADTAALGDLLAVGRPDDALAPQPGPALPAPDFVARPQRSRLAWPLAATGALVLATAAWSAVQSHQSLQAAEAQRDRMAARRPAASTASTAATAPARSPAGKPMPVARVALEARQLLATPWEATLARVEQAGAEAKDIAWLGLDATAARGELKLDGLTQDKLVALQLAEQLGHTAGWSQVVLSRFTLAEPGLAGQRFEISAKLSGSTP